MATYTWNIVSINAIPNLNNETNVVAEVTYSVSNGSFTNIKKQTITYNFTSPFTPFSSLTEAEVISWVQAALTPEGVVAEQTALDNLPLPLILPINIPLAQPLPWIVN
jgi:DNA polymerase III delta subunit